MAFQRPFLISLRREDPREPWGFRLDGGGVTDRPVTVQQVLERSLAEKSGLHEGDQVIQVGRINVQGRTLSEVQELIHTCRNRVEMFIIREDLLRNRKENEPLTVKAVVHSPYNSPFQLYSQDNVAETLATQACILTDPNIQLNHLGPKSPPTVLRSDVLTALREQGEQDRRLNGEVLTRPPLKKKKQPPPVPPKPRPPSGYPVSAPVKSSIFPGNMEQVQYQNFSTYHREEKRSTAQRTSNYEEYEEEEEETEEEEEEEEPVVVTTTTTKKTFTSQSSFTPGQTDVQRSQQQNQQTVRTQQTIQQETRQREYQQQQEQQRQAEIARQQQQQAYEQQQRQLREQQQRQAYEQQQRQIREQQAREQQAREQRAREQQAREQQAREQRAREQQARDQQQRQAAQQRQALEQQQAREAYERQQRQAQLQAQQAYEQQRAQQLRQAPVWSQPGQQRQPQYHDTEADKKLTSTTRIVPANLGSPTAQRRGGCCPSWPPKNSSVRELPKTGFSPTFVKERGSKQFVWPPPKADEMILPHPMSPHVPGHAAESWHPQETPTVARPLVPRSPTPTRRPGDSIWPPRHTIVNDTTDDYRPMPRPVCRRGRFDDYITQHSSSNVPPTYRLPPGTVHVVY